MTRVVAFPYCCLTFLQFKTFSTGLGHVKLDRLLLSSHGHDAAGRLAPHTTSLVAAKRLGARVHSRQVLSGLKIVCTGYR